MFALCLIVLLFTDTLSQAAMELRLAMLRGVTADPPIPHGLVTAHMRGGETSVTFEKNTHPHQKDS